jgi:hypothetical protein
LGPDEGGDAIEMDDTEEMGMMEAVSLKAAPKPVTSEEGGVNKKSTVAANAGAKAQSATQSSQYTLVAKWAASMTLLLTATTQKISSAKSRQQTCARHTRSKASY